MMRRNTALTSLITLGGIGYTLFRMWQMRSKPKGFRMVLHMLNDSMHSMTRMLSMARRKAKI